MTTADPTSHELNAAALSLADFAEADARGDREAADAALRQWNGNLAPLVVVLIGELSILLRGKDLHTWACDVRARNLPIAN
jgi:hypothetical protein